MSPKFLCPMVTWITWRETKHSKAVPKVTQLLHVVTPSKSSKFQRSPQNRAHGVQSRIVHGWIVPAREVIKRVLLVADANKLALTVSQTWSFAEEKRRVCPTFPKVST